ncbi:MAG: tyrosine-type recombinase/integrase [Firmicutes bacterium]|nr:tyrosine-type recombinase/integrase [Bacillota bacterium]
MAHQELTQASLDPAIAACLATHPEWAPETRRAFEIGVRRWARWAAERGVEPPPAPEDVRDWRDALAAEGLRPSTIAHHLWALRMFGRWAGWDPDPTARIHPGRQPVLAPQGLDRRAWNALLRAAARERSPKRRARDLAWLRLMGGAGLRVGEVVALRVQDLDLHPRSGQVRVRSAVAKRRVERAVPLHADVRAALQEWLAIRPAHLGDRVFDLTPRGLEARLATLAARAGIGRCHPHQLRHTFARELIRQGVPLPDVAALLGHRSLNTTARYTLPEWGELRRAVERLAVEREPEDDDED